MNGPKIDQKRYAELLADTPMPIQPTGIYHTRKMLDYAKSKGVRARDLSHEEYAMFCEFPDEQQAKIQRAM